MGRKEKNLTENLNKNFQNLNLGILDTFKN